MALEPAGVSLEAEGFQKYLKQLEEIDKKQQETFDTKFKGTGKTFAQITKAAKAYEKELKDLAKAERKAADEAKRLALQQKKVAQAQAQAAKTQKLLVAGAVVAGVTAGARAVLNFGRESLELARIQARAEAQLATAIKSTGAAAGLSSRELRNMASALQGVTNFGDEATIQAEALLLTFTSIGREAFPRALKSVLDVSTAMGQDLNTSVLQVGKALNSPIDGVSALTRAGIQFTSQQKEQIKALQESGRLFEAQGIILTELEKQFGGSAEAAREADGGIIALGNSFGDLQEQVGLLIGDLNKATGATAKLGGFFDTLGAQLRGARAQLGFGNISDEIAGLEQEIKSFQKVRDQVSAGAAPLTTKFLRLIGVADQEREIAKLDETIAELQAQLEQLNLQATVEDEEELAAATANTSGLLEAQATAAAADEAAIKALNQAVQQAEQLQLSFARAAEDAARKLARQQEDVARKTARQIAKLEERQAKDRDKLLKEQQKELDRFEDDRLKEIAKAEADVTKERQKAADDRLKQQRELQRQLAQAQARFNLSQLQSERRFALSETRLRAEGDILALQQLREDQELARQEEAENFALSQKETKDNAKEQQKEIQKDFESRINELKSSLEDQRAELLASFDEELIAQQQAQEEARAEQQRGFAEQAEDRAIALQREEEDRRISQERQLEDLGRSLANQKDVTEQGVTAIAGELEKVFGQEGVADIIISGFASRTESEFTELFGNIEQIVSGAGLGPVPGAGLNTPVQTAGGRVLPGFDEGGVVPGPVGSPQVIRAHAGETILPTHKQSFIMPAPVVPSQTLSVEMSGGFNISGGEGASAGVVDAAVEEVTETVRIAIGRIARRTNG